MERVPELSRHAPHTRTRAHARARRVCLVPLVDGALVPGVRERAGCARGLADVDTGVGADAHMRCRSGVLGRTSARWGQMAPTDCGRFFAQHVITKWPGVTAQSYTGAVKAASATTACHRQDNGKTKISPFSGNAN